MSRLEQQVGQARWRLTTNVLMQRIALGVLIATGVWTLVLLTERAFALGIPVVHGIWVAGLIAATIAAVGTYLARVKPLQAAVAIDQAAGLKERISTGLAVRRDSDPFAQAVVRDAERTAAGVHVRTHLPYRAPALWPWSAACIVAAVILGFFMPELNLLAGQDPDDPTIQRDLADAERLLNLGVQSPTLRKQIFKKLAFNYLCDVRQETKDRISREIDAEELPPAG